jgi:hypothetical protein
VVVVVAGSAVPAAFVAPSPSGGHAASHVATARAAWQASASASMSIAATAAALLSRAGLPRSPGTSRASANVTNASVAQGQQRHVAELPRDALVTPRRGRLPGHLLLLLLLVIAAATLHLSAPPIQVPLGQRT